MVIRVVIGGRIEMGEYIIVNNINLLDMDDFLLENKKTYDGLAAEYEDKSSTRELYNLEVISEFAKHIKTGKKVLDIGCAVGLDIKIFRDLGFVPVGVEFSPEMVNFARKRNPSTEIIEGNFINIEFKEKFDAVFAQAFIHLFPKAEARRILIKIRNILKDGGVLYVTTTKSEISEDGQYIEKSDYQGKPKRFRALWTQRELQDCIDSIGFKKIDYYEITDPFKKVWSIFTVKK